MTKYTTEELRFEFGKNPAYFLEHAFRHLEVLIGEYQADEISNQQFHEARDILKKQYLEAQQRAFLDEIEKRVIGEDLIDYGGQGQRPGAAFTIANDAKNDLRAKQRKALETIRKELKEEV